jgi:hypothetical protein
MYDSNWKKWVGIGKSTLCHFLNILNNILNSSGIEPKVQNSNCCFENSPGCFQGSNRRSR